MNIEYKNIIKRIISEKANEAPENGLFLVDAPTGYGKTEQIIQFALENYKKHKIFIITSQLKVLPDKEKMLKSITDEGLKKEVSEQILTLGSIKDSYADNFKNVVIEIEKNKSFYADNEELIKKIKVILEINKNVSGEFFSKAEREFREKIKRGIEDKKVNLEWVKILYPTVEIKDKNIILMTVKKFFNKIDTITDGSYYLYQDRVYDNSLIIIDEFDSTKKELLDIIIDEKENDSVEVFRLFRKLDQAIIDDEFIRGFPRDNLNSDITDGYDYATEYQNNLRIEFERINDEVKNIFYENQDSAVIKKHYPLKAHFKTNNFNIDKSFLFNDGNKTSALNYNQQRKYKIEEYKGYNLIIEDKGTKNDLILSELYKYAKKAINSFVHLTARMIINDYKKAHDMTIGKDSRKESKIQDIYTSIIDKMNLGVENKKFLVNQIRNRIATFGAAKKSKLIVNKEEYDRRKKTSTFYNKGFSYVSMRDSDDHNMETKFFMYNYEKTPEYFMLNLARKYFVIGLSATVLFPSILKNYDIDYLKIELDDKYSELTEKERQEIKIDYEEINEKVYRNTQVEVLSTFDLIGKSVDSASNDESYLLKEVIKKVFKEKNIDGIYDNHVIRKNSDESQMYFLDTIANIYLAADEFSKNKELESFIFFTNADLSNKEPEKSIIKEHITKIDPNIHLFILNAKSYEDYYKEMKENNKVFIITAYNTVGTGVNLQYQKDDENKKGDENKKDVQGIFLSKPTNVIPSIDSFYSNNKDLVRYIYGMHYLAVYDEIDRKTLVKHVQEAFNAVYSNHKRPSFKHNDIAQIQYAQLLVITQAIGRISRTYNKGSKILVCMDEEVKAILSKRVDVFENSMITYELEKIVDKTKKNKRTIIHRDDERMRVYKSSYKFITGYIPNYRKWTWPDDKIDEWQKIRDFVLKYPILKKEDIDKFEKDVFTKNLIEQCYFKDEGIRSYSYKYGFNDYKKNIANGFTTSRNTVSFYDAKLHYFIKRRGTQSRLHEAFYRKGYATSFDEGDYIMAPYMYTAIYKAAVGETVGRIILEQRRLELKDIEKNDVFERFDYVYDDDVYFDFKNWSGNFKQKEYASLKKLDRKVAAVHPSVIFVINTFDVGYSKEHLYTIDEGVYVITIPRLISEDGTIDETMINVIVRSIVDRR